MNNTAAQIPPSESKDVQNFYYTKNWLKHPNIEVGEYTYGIPTVQWIGGNVFLKIGKFCSIASSTEIMMSGNHRTEFVSSYPFAALKSDWPKAEGITPISKGDVIIGNDVWIGDKALILSGVTIGDGAVIGARAVVSQDIPAYGIAAGNPARVTKKRFDEKTIDMLLAVRWWDWDVEKIRRNMHIISSPHLDKLEECE